MGAGDGEFVAQGGGIGIGRARVLQRTLEDAVKGLAESGGAVEDDRRRAGVVHGETRQGWRFTGLDDAG